MKTRRTLLLSGLVLAACAAPAPSNGPGQPAPTTVRFLFGLDGEATDAENFIAATAVPDVIEQCRAELGKPFGSRTLHINGAIARDSGGQNLKWHWAHRPNEWQLAQMSVEVCNGRPSDVEANLDYWVDKVGRFCPWRSRVLQELP